jgi:hypothetical protein
MKFRRYKRHIFAKLLLLILIIVGIVNAVEIIRFLPKHNETFQGGLSAETYSSVDETIQGYIANELQGYATMVDSYQYEIVKEENKIGVLTAYADDDEEEEQKVKVTFTCGEETYEVYLNICYLEDDSFRYWVLPSSNGEVITKSYFDSVLSSDNYTNYTIQEKQTGSVSIFGVPLKVSTNGTMRIAENNGYYNYSEGFLGSSYKLDVYMQDTANGLACYGKEEGSFSNKVINQILEAVGVDVDLEDISEDYQTEWGQYTMSNLWGSCQSIADIARVGFPDEIDHTFFVKTSTGFKVNPEKQQAFTEIMLKATTKMMGYTDENITKFFELANFSIDASFYVYEGKLSKVVVKKSASFKDVDWKSYFDIDEDLPETLMNFINSFKVTASSECLYTNYGSTQVQLTEDSERFFKNYSKE